MIVCLILAGGAMFLVCEANRAVSEAQRVAAWNKTRGKLLELKIIYQPGLKYSGYHVIPLYSFQAGGREVTGRGMYGTTTAGSAQSLKEQLKPWLTETLARVSEQTNIASYEFIYSPFSQTVPVYYDPADPSRSYFGIPSSSPPSYAGTMRWLGWITMFPGCGGMLILAVGWWSDRSREKSRRLSEAQLAVGLPTPTLKDEREFVRRIDAAIDVIEGAITEDACYERLSSTLESLKAMRTNPARELLHCDRLGFHRCLSGEWDIENWGPAGRRVLSATDDVESFHQRWRDRK